MASRSLQVRLAVDRPDPIAWTEASRGRILAALYTIMLGNPRLRASNPGPAETRFKMWWHLVGSAVEHAAKLHAAETSLRIAAMVDDPPACPPTTISFRELFLDGEADEEQTSSLATVLDVLRSMWPNGFKASDVALFAGQASEGAVEFKAALEQASGKPLPVITATTVSWRLKGLKDAPVMIGDDTLTLRYQPDKEGGAFTVTPVRR